MPIVSAYRFKDPGDVIYHIGYQTGGVLTRVKAVRSLGTFGLNGQLKTVGYGILGFRFQIGGQDYYSAVSISMGAVLNTGGSYDVLFFTVHSWACESQHDVSILAGESPSPRARACCSSGRCCRSITLAETKKQIR